MKLLAEIDKDAKLFYREGRTVTLLFVVPIIILLVLSAVFGKVTGDQTLNIQVGFCDLDKSTFSKDFMTGIGASVVDFSNEADCNRTVYDAVASGKLGAALVLAPGFENGIKNGEIQKLELIIDNTRVQTAPSIEAFFRASADSSSQKISVEYVSRIWDKIKEADVKLTGLKNDTIQTKKRAQEITDKLRATKEQLESVDFSVMTVALSEANQTIQATNTSLSEAYANLTAIESKFQTYDQALLESENDLANISIIARDAATTISSTVNQFNCSANSTGGLCGSLITVNSSIGSVDRNVNNRLAKIRLARQELNTTNQTVQEFKLKINQSREGTALALVKINELNTFVETLSKNRDSALVTLAEADGATDALVIKIDEMNGLIDTAQEQIREITAREPIAVVSPINLQSVNVYERKTFFDFLLPGLIPIIMMFLSLFLSSTSLVREKMSGTLERIFISQIFSVEYAAIKVISYAVVLFPQLVILLLMSSLIFNGFSIFNFETVSYLVAVGVLMMMVFNALGFIIAAYSDSESTAFLASLVIGLPLLFMSGLIFAFDFMPPFMAQIGELSPLSQGIIGMQSVINYNAPNPEIVSNLGAYVLVLNLIAIIVINMKMKG